MSISSIYKLWLWDTDAPVNVTLIFDPDLDREYECQIWKQYHLSFKSKSQLMWFFFSFISFHPPTKILDKNCQICSYLTKTGIRQRCMKTAYYISFLFLYIVFLRLNISNIKVFCMQTDWQRKNYMSRSIDTGA